MTTREQAQEDTMTMRLLSVADMLKALREDIQAENTLIASRVTWYVTSQSFLLTAYATSWNANFRWSAFFHEFLPLAAIALSAVIWASISAATWAQDVYLREQKALVAQLHVQADAELSPEDRIALSVYERTMVSNRTSTSGRIIGGRIHALVRITPLALPVGFTVLWLYALMYSPVR